MKLENNHNIQQVFNNSQNGSKKNAPEKNVPPEICLLENSPQKIAPGKLP